MRRCVAMLVFVCLTAVTAAEAQETIAGPMINAEQFKFALTKARREVFDAGMALSGADKDAFWNIYAEFEKEKSVLDDKRGALLKEYATKKSQLTDAQAVKLVNDFGAVAQDEVKLRQKYTNAMAKKIPGTLAARFYQLDAYITSAMTFELLDQMDLIGVH
jgi:hypothetical protein